MRGGVRNGRGASATRTLAVSALGAAAIVLGACASQPDVTLDSARVIEQSGEAVVVGVVLRAKNPNADALPLDSASYTASITGPAGVSTFSTTRSPEATLSAGGTHTFMIPVVLPAGTVGGERTINVSGSLVYRQPGVFSDVLFNYGLLRPRVGFNVSAKVDVPASAPAPAMTTAR